MGKTRASKRRRKNEEENEEKQAVEAKNTKLDTEKVGAAKNNNKSPVVVFAHGAGAPSTSDWMIRWKELLAKALGAVEVITFDYPHLSGGKKRAPPKAEKLVAFHSDIIKKAVVKYPEHPLVLVGKSMGSRVSCMVAGSEDIHASAVVCLGYPLKNARVNNDDMFYFKIKLLLQGMKGAIRDDTLLQLKVPTMFVQGSKDALCPLDKLKVVREKMTSVSELYVIEGGDHSFKIGKKHLQLEESSQEEADECAANAISNFISRLMEGR